MDRATAPTRRRRRLRVACSAAAAASEAVAQCCCEAGRALHLCCTAGCAWCTRADDERRRRRRTRLARRRRELGLARRCCCFARIDELHRRTPGAQRARLRGAGRAVRSAAADGGVGGVPARPPRQRAARTHRVAADVRVLALCRVFCVCIKVCKVRRAPRHTTCGAASSNLASAARIARRPPAAGLPPPRSAWALPAAACARAIPVSVLLHGPLLQQHHRPAGNFCHVAAPVCSTSGRVAILLLLLGVWRLLALSTGPLGPRHLCLPRPRMGPAAGGVVELGVRR